MNGCLKHTFILLATLAAAACSREQETGPIGGSGSGTVEISTRAEGGYEGTSVLAFRKADDGRYAYQSRFDGPWKADGTASVTLPLGDYRFVFFRSPSVSTSAVEPQTGVTEPEQIRFTAKADAAGNILPADEIFLPAEAETAAEYHIADPTTVRSVLTRAVSRVDILLKRGRTDGTGFTEMPYTDGRTVLDEMDNLNIEINGVGTTLYVGGTQGSGSTAVRFTPRQAAEVSPEGFARFTGPLVFPPAPGKGLNVTAAYNPAAGSAVPVLTGSASSALTANRVLEVTLWITSDYKFIEITAETRPISAETDGDSGLWQ